MAEREVELVRVEELILASERGCKVIEKMKHQVKDTNKRHLKRAEETSDERKYQILDKREEVDSD